MKRWRVGSISMGASLIGAGCLLLAGEIGGFDGAYMILRWWPVILVILGLEMLVYVGTSKEPNTKVKIDGVSIFTILFIVIVSAVIYGGTSFMQSGVGDLLLSNTGYSKYTSVFTKELQIPAKGVSELEFEDRADVRFEQYEGDKIKVNVGMTIRNNDEKYTSEIAKKLIEIKEGSRVKIGSLRELYEQDRVKIADIDLKYIIKIPRSIKLYIKNIYGVVEAKGIEQDIVMEGKHNEIFFDNINGNVKIEESYSDMEIRHITKNINIYNNHGEIEIIDVNGNVDIESRYDELSCERVGGNLKVEARHDDIELLKVTGDILVQNEYGNIEVNDCQGKVDIVNEHADIKYEASDVRHNNLTIKNEYGNVDVGLSDKQQGKFDIRTRHGNIIADDILTNSVSGSETKEERLIQTVKEENPLIQIQVRHGNVLLEAK